MLWWCGLAGERGIFFDSPHTHPPRAYLYCLLWLLCTDECPAKIIQHLQGKTEFLQCHFSLRKVHTHHPATEPVFPRRKVAGVYSTEPWRLTPQVHLSFPCPTFTSFSSHSSYLLSFPLRPKNSSVTFSLPNVGAPLLTSQRQTVHLTALKHNTFVCFRYAGRPHRFWLNAAGRVSTLLTVAVHSRAKGTYRTSLFCPFRIGEIRQQMSVLTDVVCQG